MLSRRLLRVKVMQTVYAYHKNEGMTLQQAENNLLHSIHKSFELYHLCLLLLVDVRLYAENRIEIGRNKKRPSFAELNPNTRFIDNRLLNLLSENKQLLKFIEQTGLSWSNYPEVVKSVYEQICESELYTEYMASDKTTFENDHKFIVKLTEKVIAQNEMLYNNIEEQSIFWNDESEFVMSMVIKTLKEYKERSGINQQLLQEFKDEDDREFVVTLLRKAILNHSELPDMIKKFSKNWDPDRIAFMDVVLMEIALAEIMEFSTIPIKVTLNEYIELAKHYSTPKSGFFINGLLDKIITEYKQLGRIRKIGSEMLELN